MSFHRWSAHLSRLAAASTSAATIQVSAKLEVNRQQEVVQRRLRSLRSEEGAESERCSEVGAPRRGNSSLPVSRGSVTAGHGTVSRRHSAPLSQGESLDLIRTLPTQRGGNEKLPRQHSAGEVEDEALEEAHAHGVAGQAAESVMCEEVWQANSTRESDDERIESSLEQLMAAIAVLKSASEETAMRVQEIGAHLRKLKWRIHFIGVSRRMLTLLEGTLGWVAGCAWTEMTVAIYPTIAEFPTTASVLLENVQVALCLSVLAFVWITFTGNGLKEANEEGCANEEGRRSDEIDGIEPPGHEHNTRAEPASEDARATCERIFISGAFSFFTGWAWIAVVRCIWLMPYAYLGWNRDAIGVDYGWYRYVLELLLTLTFCPIATWFVVRAALSTKTAYEASSSLARWRRHARTMRVLRVFGRAAAAAAAARHAAAARLNSRRASRAGIQSARSSLQEAFLPERAH